MAPATRKHLDNLLEDYARRNAETYGDKKPGAVGEVKPATRMSMGTAVALGEAGQDDDSRFDPPYTRPGQHAKEVARKVNSKRTPSGNFFETTNPSLHMAPRPLTKPLVEPLAQKAVKAMGGTLLRDLPPPSMVPTPEPELGPDGEKPPLSPYTLSKMEITWLMPTQTGDRKKGKQFAKLVSGKRTPSGGFVAPEGP